MPQASGIEARLRQAASLPETLAAGFDQIGDQVQGGESYRGQPGDKGRNALPTTELNFMRPARQA
jgi:hypothetical protein